MEQFKVGKKLSRLILHHILDYADYPPYNCTTGYQDDLRRYEIRLPCDKMRLPFKDEIEWWAYRLGVKLDAQDFDGLYMYDTRVGTLVLPMRLSCEELMAVRALAEAWGRDPESRQFDATRNFIIYTIVRRHIDKMRYFVAALVIKGARFIYREKDGKLWVHYDYRNFFGSISVPPDITSITPDIEAYLPLKKRGKRKEEIAQEIAKRVREVGTVWIKLEPDDSRIDMMELDDAIKKAEKLINVELTDYRIDDFLVVEPKDY